MKQRTKGCLLAVVVVLLMVCAIPFVPSIFRNYTRPLYKNWKSGRQWYGKIDAENLDQVRDYCSKNDFNTTYYMLVDYSIPSGKKRCFVYNLQTGRKIMSSYCLHGNGPGNTAAKPKFSNDVGSKCSSLGRFVMVGKGSSTMRNAIRLRGLDRSNYKAESRGILIHSAGRVSRFRGQSEYLPLGPECEGCIVVSRDFQMKMLEVLNNTTRKHPVLIYAKYK